MVLARITQQKQLDWARGNYERLWYKLVALVRYQYGPNDGLKSYVWLDKPAKNKGNHSEGCDNIKVSGSLLVITISALHNYRNLGLLKIRTSIEGRSVSQLPELSPRTQDLKSVICLMNHHLLQLLEWSNLIAASLYSQRFLNESA